MLLGSLRNEMKAMRNRATLEISTRDQAFSMLQSEVQALKEQVSVHGPPPQSLRTNPAPNNWWQADLRRDEMREAGRSLLELQREGHLQSRTLARTHTQADHEIKVLRNKLREQKELHCVQLQVRLRS